MRDLITELGDAKSAGREVACCRLVETRGSTPQKPGALMLVYPDGRQSGTLGGGCVEAEVKRRALAVLASGEATVCRFQLDDDYGWDDGLVCGGRMHVLLDPLADDGASAYLARWTQLVRYGEGCTEAIVFDGEKSGTAESAAYLFDADGELVAQLRAGGEKPPAVVAAGLVPLDKRPRPSAAHGVAFLPLLPRCRLLIVGGGHVGQAVGRLAVDLDFDVWVVDDRPEYVTDERFAGAERRIAGPIGATLANLEITPNTFCLIVTRGHNHDEEALYHLADRGARYVGMIGSGRKIRLIIDDLLAEGVRQEALDRVRAPVGLDIGSQTVAEIAVSIAAELVACRNLATTPERAPRALAANVADEAGAHYDAGAHGAAGATSS